MTESSVDQELEQLRARVAALEYLHHENQQAAHQQELCRTADDHLVNLRPKNVETAEAVWEN